MQQMLPAGIDVVVIYYACETLDHQDGQRISFFKHFCFEWEGNMKKKMIIKSVMTKVLVY